jgi:DNA-binding cell septation regulator SpoVG
MTKRRKIDEISEVIFYPITPTSKGLVCYVSFTFRNQIRINDIGIYTRPEGGYRLVYPVKLQANGKAISSVYPINKPIGKKIEDFLLLEYNKFIQQRTKNES